MRLTTRSIRSSSAPEEGAPRAGAGFATGSRSGNGDAAPALAARMYRDRAVLDAELDRIFARTWQYAGHVGDLPQPGSYVTAVAGDQPVLVLRGADGEPRAFRNVCRHRGSELLTGSGRCKRAIRCRYHGWTYDSADGRLLGVPEHRSFTALDKSKLGLEPIRIETLAGLIFVNLDPEAAPLDASAAGLGHRLEHYRLAELVRVGDFPQTSQAANWKIVAENYLEGYHVPIAHPGLMRLFDYKRYAVELHEGWAWFEAPMRRAPSGNLAERLYQRAVRPMPGLRPEDGRVWRYAFLYPNTAIDLYPDQVNVWQIRPDGVADAGDVWSAFGASRRGPLTRLAQRMNHVVNARVMREDVDLVTGVQRGLATRGYEPGPLAGPEAAIGWFAERVRRDLEAAPG